MIELHKANFLKDLFVQMLFSACLFIFNVAAYLTDEQKQWFVDYFKKLCKVGLTAEKLKANKDIDKDISPTVSCIPYLAVNYVLFFTLELFQGVRSGYNISLHKVC